MIFSFLIKIPQRKCFCGFFFACTCVCLCFIIVIARILYRITSITWTKECFQFDTVQNMNRSCGNDDDNCADAKNILLFDSKYNESSSNNSTRKKMWGNKKKMLVDDNGNDNARSDLKFCNLKKTHTHIDVMHFLWMWHSNIKSWKQTLVLPQSIVHSISFPGFVCVFGAFGNKIHAINKLQVSFSPLMHTLQINIKWIRRTNERTLSLSQK